MDIELKSGERLYEFPSNVAQALIYLGLASKLERPVPAQETKWRYFIGALGGSGKFAIQRKKNAETQWAYGGNGAAIKKIFPDCPQSVIDQFLLMPEKDRLG